MQIKAGANVRPRTKPHSGTPSKTTRPHKVFNLIAVFVVLATVLFAGCAWNPRFSGGKTYEQRFSEEIALSAHFISNPALVDTNNEACFLTNNPPPFFKLQEAGEFARVKLGMTMSQVVKLWGKPRAISPKCGIGPRFYYGNEVSLYFRDDRLVRFSFYHPYSAVFDNGLRLFLPKAKIETLFRSSARPVTEHSSVLDITNASAKVRTRLTLHELEEPGQQLTRIDVELLEYTKLPGEKTAF